MFVPHLFHYKNSRYALTAITALCALLTWYSLPTNHREQPHRQFFGDYHACLRSSSPVPANLPGVLQTQAALTGKAQVQLPNGTPSVTGMGDFPAVDLIAMKNNTPFLPCISGRWCNAPDECVISTDIADRLTSYYHLPIRVGDKLLVSSRHVQSLLTITGIVRQGKPRSAATPQTFQFGFGQALGTSPSTAMPRAPRRLQQLPYGIYVSTLHNLRLRPQHLLFLKWDSLPSKNECIQRLSALLPEQPELLRYHPYSLTPISPDTAEAISLQNQQTLFHSTGLLAMSIAIILITLLLDLEEQRQNLLILRLCGLSPRRAASLIILRTLLLAIPGAFLGILIATMLRSIQISYQLHQFTLFIPTWRCIHHVLLSAFAAALLAALLPAYLAATRPIWHQTQSSIRTIRLKPILLNSLAALLCLLLYFALLNLYFRVPFLKQAIHIAIPLLLLASLVLLLPGATMLLEYLLVPLLGKIFHVHPMLLRRFISGKRWQGYGMLLSLCAALWLFASIHVWSASMLTLFTVPDTIPDMLVRCHPSIANKDTANAIRHLATNQQVMKLCVLQPELAGTTLTRLQAKNIQTTNAVVLGLNGNQAWSPQQPWLRLQFIEGTPQTARQEFSKWNNPVCVIPDTLAYHAQLHPGDFLELEHNQQLFKLKVVGVVRFPWVWFSKCSGVRIRKSRTSALIFAPRQFLLSKMDAPDHQFFWLNSNLPFPQMEQSLREMAQRQAKHSRLPFKKSFSGGTRWDSGLNQHRLQLSSNQSLNNSLNSRTRGVVQNMTRLPLLALCLASIAVVCIMSSIHKNRLKEYQILSCNGMTSHAIRRLLFAETCLTSLLAILLSLGAALLYSWFALHLVNLAPIFGVITPPLHIPWRQLYPGALATLLICLLAVFKIPIKTSSSNNN